MIYLTQYICVYMLNLPFYIELYMVKITVYIYIYIYIYILLTKTTAAQIEDALSNYRVRGLYSPAVVFVATIYTFLHFS